MLAILRNRLLLRLCALTILTFSFVLVSRSDGNSVLSSSPQTSVASRQAEDPTVTVAIQKDSPLAISSISTISRIPSDSQFVEFGFYVLNVSPKPIRAYAIKQDVLAGGTKVGGGVALYNSQLTNSVLPPNQSAFIPSNSDIISDKKNTIILSVDFVEFADGSRWGADSVGSAERASGQRAGAYSMSQHLLQVLSKGGAEDVAREIESGTLNIVPPEERPETWKEGFRAGRNIVVNKLKNTKAKSGTNELEREVRRLADTLKGKN